MAACDVRRCPPRHPLKAASIYRPCVAAILENGNARVLIGERADRPGSWQFPQGGLEPGEDPETGLRRELREELSLDPTQYAVGPCRGPYRYLFPPGRTKAGYLGQKQHYFRLRLLGPESSVDIHTAHPEFRTVSWIDPAEFSLAWLPPMKHGVYREVFRDFFGVEIS